MQKNITNDNSMNSKLHLSSALAAKAGSVRRGGPGRDVYVGGPRLNSAGSALFAMLDQPGEGPDLSSGPQSPAKEENVRKRESIMRIKTEAETNRALSIDRNKTNQYDSTNNPARTQTAAAASSSASSSAVAPARKDRFIVTHAESVKYRAAAAGSVSSSASDSEPIGKFQRGADRPDGTAERVPSPPKSKSSSKLLPPEEKNPNKGNIGNGGLQDMDLDEGVNSFDENMMSNNAKNSTSFSESSGGFGPPMRTQSNFDRIMRHQVRIHKSMNTNNSIFLYPYFIDIVVEWESSSH